MARGGEKAGSRHVEAAGSRDMGWRSGRRWVYRTKEMERSVGGTREMVRRRCREVMARLVDGLDDGAARAAAGIAERRDDALFDAVLGRGAGTTLPCERAERRVVAVQYLTSIHKAHALVRVM